MNYLSIVLPCLNESETLQICLEKCFKSLKKYPEKCEVIVADNGSTDGSQEIAKRYGAKIVTVLEKGYGSALRGGIAAANSKFILMADADDSYALDEIDIFIQELEKGHDLVMGNRFKGGIQKGAMPWLHKYIGNPVLSLIGKTLFNIKINDFHCGIRAFKKESIEKLNLKTKGMEFASEMIVKAAMKNLKITEVPTILKKDGRSRKPHLKTWSDGWKHLVFMLTSSPKWLFIYPGLFLNLMTLIGVFTLLIGPINFLQYQIHLNSYFILIGLNLISTQLIILGVLSEIFSDSYSLLKKKSILFHSFSFERSLITGLLFFTIGVISLAVIFYFWDGNSIENIDFETSLKISGLVVLLMGIGIQLIFSSFFGQMLKNKVNSA